MTLRDCFTTLFKINDREEFLLQVRGFFLAFMRMWKGRDYKILKLVAYLIRNENVGETPKREQLEKLIYNKVSHRRWDSPCSDKVNGLWPNVYQHVHLCQVFVWLWLDTEKTPTSDVLVYRKIYQGENDPWWQKQFNGNLDLFWSEAQKFVALQKAPNFKWPMRRHLYPKKKRTVDTWKTRLPTGKVIKSYKN
jgi:hypothetical protein